MLQEQPGLLLRVQLGSNLLRYYRQWQHHHLKGQPQLQLVQWRAVLGGRARLSTLPALFQLVLCSETVELLLLEVFNFHLVKFVLRWSCRLSQEPCLACSCIVFVKTASTQSKCDFNNGHGCHDGFRQQSNQSDLAAVLPVRTMQSAFKMYCEL